MKFSKLTYHAIEVSKKAGKILKEGFSKTFKVFNKEGIHNLVTEYDLKSEKYIIGALKKEFPSHSFLSEEKGLLKNKNSSNMWIIDPLDGTVNFFHKIPIFCVSIAFRKNNKTVAGVVFNPIHNELFVAEDKKGAYLNNKKLKVTSTNKLEKAFLATGFPYNLNKNPKSCINHFLAISKKGIPIRKIGSAALSLSYVADGRFDGFWETNLGPWDIAAANLLIKEASGKVTDWEGNPIKIKAKNTILATNGKIHKPLEEILKKKIKLPNKKISC